MELVLFALWCFAVAAAGGLVGLVLGNLRLPATVALAAGAAEAAGTNLAISAIAAATAAFVHLRAGRVNWRLFAWMAPPSIAGAAAGGYLSSTAPDGLLLGLIAAILFSSAYELFQKPPAPRPDAGEDLDFRAAAVTGAAIGALGGVVGLILGSLRMPALLRYVGEAPHRAVGTNVAIGLLVGVAGALAHVPEAPPDLELVLIGAAASIPGALLGSRLTGRLDDAQLIRGIAVVLVLAGAACAVQAIP